MPKKWNMKRKYVAACRGCDVGAYGIRIGFEGALHNLRIIREQQQHIIHPPEKKLQYSTMAP